MRMRPKRPILTAMKNPGRLFGCAQGASCQIDPRTGQAVQVGSIANVCPPGYVPMNGRCVAEVGPQLQYGQRYSNPPVPGNPLPPPTMWHTPGSIGSGVLHGMDGSTRQVELYGYQHQGGTNGPIWVNIASSSIAIPPGGFPSWPPPLPPPDWVRASYLPTPPHAAGGHPVRRWVRITALWNNPGTNTIPVG